MLPVMTFDGTVVNEPEMRFTPSGKAVVNFRIVANDRKKQQDGTWADGPATFLRVNAWERLAENIAESVTKGDRVIVVGKLTQNEFEDKEGNKRTSYEIQAFNVAASMLFATVKVNKIARESAGEAPTVGRQPDEPPPF